jgi:quercetin dioxygenase-like cupin family protein
MDIARDRPESRKGPDDWFTGDVWMDTIQAVGDVGAPEERGQALSVHFSPGARTAWHHHPHGQVLHVLEGEGRAQSRGGPVEVIRPGDTIRFDPGEEHWHGAAPHAFMTHLAIQGADGDSVPTHWGEHVTDEEYLTEPA